MSAMMNNDEKKKKSPGPKSSLKNFNGLNSNINISVLRDQLNGTMMTLDGSPRNSSPLTREMAKNSVSEDVSMTDNKQVNFAIGLKSNMVPGFTFDTIGKSTLASPKFA